MTLPKQLKILNDNHSTAIAISIIIAAAIWLYGCEPKTMSLLDPAKQITRAELEAESALLIARINTAQSDLQKKEQVKKTILDQAAIFSTTGQFNPIGALNGIISVFAVGSALDSKRKLKAITTKRSEV
jgi:hypothetical protein